MVTLFCCSKRSNGNKLILDNVIKVNKQGNQLYMQGNKIYEISISEHLGQRLMMN